MHTPCPARSRTERRVHAPIALRYRVVSVLGRGGMATVFLADDTVADDVVALKVLDVHEREGRYEARFAIEAVTMSLLTHPHVVRVRDMGVDDETGVSYVAMDLAERGSVAAFVQHEGPPAVGLVATWGVQVLSALAVAHGRGIVHRDVKPANILLDREGNALLSDFGVARTPDDDLPVHVVVGTPAFMPPEQRARPAAVGPYADLYALGATLYALVTGDSPRELWRSSIRDPRWASVPPELRATIWRATRAEPEARFPDARAMAHELRPWVPSAVMAQPHLAAWVDGRSTRSHDQGTVSAGRS